MLNPKKVIPKTIGQCKCLCCSDCEYYDEDVLWTGCEQRNKLTREYSYRRGKLGV